MRSLSNSCSKGVARTQRGRIRSRNVGCSLLTASCLLGLLGGWELSKAGPIELTSSFVGSFISQLGDASQKAKLGIYDRLVFGTAGVLGVEGRSRKHVLLRLDEEGQILVRLWDLSKLEIKQVKAQRVLQFCGVLSTVNQVSQGPVEISVTYSSISSRGDCAYAPQALEFVKRHGELQRQNQAIQARGQVADPAAAAGASQESAASAEADPSADSTGQGEPSRLPARPALLRRGQAQGPTAPASAPRSDEPTFVGQGGESDVVIYRRGRPKPASEAPAGPQVQAQVRSQGRKEVDGMIRVPGGSVTLGSDDPADDQGALHRVFVAAFYLDKFEVTNEEYRAFCEATGHRAPSDWTEGGYPTGKDKHPVVWVSWLDAMAYARWVGKRLPSEAEWERAAEGSRNRRYDYGNVYSPSRANTESGKTAEVGAYSPNEFGIYDLTGNVSEWTGSLYRPYPYEQADGREDIDSSGSRVVRGGHHSGKELTVRCLVRERLSPDQARPTVGFRCARDDQ